MNRRDEEKFSQASGVREMRRKIMAVAAMIVLMGCGSAEVRERPEDCEAHQVFNEDRERCESCSASPAPECLPGCGFEVVEDGRGCPVLRCPAACEGCDEGESWDNEEQRCVTGE